MEHGSGQALTHCSAQKRKKTWNTKSKFHVSQVLHTSETISPGKKGYKCKIYDKGFSDSRRFVKHIRHTVQHDKLLPTFRLKMFCHNHFEIVLLHMVQPWFSQLIGTDMTVMITWIHLQCKMPVWFQELMKYRWWKHKVTSKSIKAWRLIFNKSTKRCKFLGFYGGVPEISVLLGYATSHPRRMETSNMKHFSNHKIH